MDELRCANTMYEASLICLDPDKKVVRVVFDNDDARGETMYDDDDDDAITARGTEESATFISSGRSNMSKHGFITSTSLSPI